MRPETMQHLIKMILHLIKFVFLFPGMVAGAIVGGLLHGFWWGFSLSRKTGRDVMQAKVNKAISGEAQP